MHRSGLIALGVLCGVQSAFTQIHSTSVVGYVRRSVPVGFCILANPLTKQTNNLNNLLAAAPNNTRAYRFDPHTMNYVSSTRLPIGWAPDLIFDPGEGFFVQAQAPFELTFAGKVLQGQLSTPLRGGNAFQIKGSMVPEALPLGRPGALQPTLGFPATAGTRVFIFTKEAGYRTYTFNGTLNSWLGPGGTAEGPVIGLAEGFFLQRPGADGAWTRSFSVFD